MPLSPAQIAKVIVHDSEKKSMEVIVPDNQLSLAIGKRGQNARLGAKLTGWKIDIFSEAKKSLAMEAEKALWEIPTVTDEEENVEGIESPERLMNKKMVKAGSGFTPGRPWVGRHRRERSDVRVSDKISKIRTCLGCRVSKEKEELVRLMKSPDGIVVIDYKRTSPAEVLMSARQSHASGMHFQGSRLQGCLKFHRLREWMSSLTA